MDRPHIQSTAELDERDLVNRALAKRDFDDLKSEVQELRASVDGLVKAWNTATSLVTFVKWVAGFIAAGVAVYALIKGKFSV